MNSVKTFLRMLLRRPKMGSTLEFLAGQMHPRSNYGFFGFFPCFHWWSLGRPPVMQAPETAEKEEPAKEEPKAEARCGWEIMLCEIELWINWAHGRGAQTVYSKKLNLQFQVKSLWICFLTLGFMEQKQAWTMQPMHQVRWLSTRYVEPTQVS